MANALVSVARWERRFAGLVALPHVLKRTRASSRIADLVRRERNPSRRTCDRRPPVRPRNIARVAQAGLPAGSEAQPAKVLLARVTGNGGLPEP